MTYTNLVEFNWERLTDNLRNELSSLVEAHEAEMPSATEKPLDIDWDFFQKAADSGQLRIYAARRGSCLVGYAVCSLGMDPFHKSTSVAFITAIYAKPSERGFGPRFVRWIENELAERGAYGILWSVSSQSRMGSLLERMNYKKSDELYWGRIGGS